MWIVFSFSSNVFASWLEYVYRSQAFPTFWLALPKIIIPVVLLQFCIFYSFRLAPNLMLAGAMFTLTNLLIRVAVMYKVGDVVDWRTYVTVIFMISAVLIQFVPKQIS